MDVEAVDHVGASSRTILAQDLNVKLPGDRAKIIDIVSDVLPGWKAVEHGRVEIRKTSGHGGSQTYKLSAADVEPQYLALHSRSPEAQSNALSEERMGVAWAVFAQNGLAPRRLAQGGNWYIEEWGGKTLSKTDLATLPEDLGRFLAKIHQVPKDWFDVFRARLKNDIPALERVPDGSHIWWFSARKDMISEFDEVEMEKWAASMPAPRSEIAARLVTVHADFHLGNLVLGPEGIKSIDLEFACVTFAVQDLSYAMVTCGLKGQAAKRAFLKAYCQAMGDAAPESVIDELLVDSEAYVLAQHFGPLAPWRMNGIESEQEDVQAMLNISEQARNSAALRDKLANYGIMDMRPWHERLSRNICGLQVHLKHGARKHPMMAILLTAIIPLLLILHLVLVCVLIIPCVLRNHSWKHGLPEIPHFLGLRRTGNRSIVFFSELLFVFLVLLIWPILLFLVPLWSCRRSRRKNGKWAAPPWEPGLVPYDRLSVCASGDEAGPGEHVENLLDESKKTDTPPCFTCKWNHVSAGKPCWIEVKVDGQAITLERYALRSANDCPARDPKAWKVHGVDSRGNLHTLHNVEDASWNGRWSWNEYLVSIESGSVSSFRKFRIDISANGGDHCTQLGQLKLFGSTVAEAVVFGQPELHAEMPGQVSQTTTTTEPCVPRDAWAEDCAIGNSSGNMTETTLQSDCVPAQTRL